MYERPRRARVALVLLLVASAAVVTLDFREPEHGPVERLRGAAVALVAPLQQAASGLVRPLGQAVAGIREVGTLRARNRRLEAEADRLRTQERTYLDLLAENERLRGALGMARRCGCRTVGATVVASSGSSFAWSVTIDAGAGQGIAPGMPVIDARGLVGRVARVSAGHATVLLVADPSSGVAARLAGTRAAGLLRGRGQAELSFEPLRADTQVRPGEAVVTQAYEGGAFPGGLPVGIVSRVERTSGLVHRAWVRPFADPGTLDVVAVVVAAPAPPGPAGR